MVLENVCAPALLYLAFSIIQIVIDMYRGDTIQAFFKFIVMIIFTIVLNAICNSGMTIISWFIVFIPFILMTYVTTILFFVFGINPSKIQPSDKKCWETQFGCCDDGITAKQDPSGRSCPRMRLANVLGVHEPTPWNNKDGHYIYPSGRSSHEYSLHGGSVRTNKGDGHNHDHDYYKSKSHSHSGYKHTDHKDSGHKSFDRKTTYVAKLISETGNIIIGVIQTTKDVLVITKAVKAKPAPTGTTAADTANAAALVTYKATASTIETAANAANSEADEALLLINSAKTFDLVKAAKVAAEKAKTNADAAKASATALKTAAGV
uniref:Uncharacterized protein n=1 Tax=viral metagenome TaxID=1070528 RepID=A0A6C0EWM1_9ZZZZ